jgi:hypothetical protein
MRFLLPIAISSVLLSGCSDYNLFGLTNSDYKKASFAQAKGKYQADVFESPDTHSPQHHQKQKANVPARDALAPSFVQIDDFESSRQFMRPFASLQEAKAASVKLEADKEQLADKVAINQSKIEVLRNEIQSQIQSAKREKQEAEERIAKRGMASSFLQDGLAPDSFIQTGLDVTARELERVNEMQRSWKLAADRLAHTDLASEEPSAALIDANSKVEADKKKVARLEAKVNEDLEKIQKDVSVIAAQQDQTKRARATRDFNKNVIV